MSRARYRSRRAELAALRTDMVKAGATVPQIAAAIQARFSDLNARVACRYACGLTQQEVADRWNQLWPSDRPLTCQQISYWENWPAPTGRQPSIEDLTRLARIYHCRTADLLDSEDTATDPLNNSAPIITMPGSVTGTSLPGRAKRTVLCAGEHRNDVLPGLDLPMPAPPQPTQVILAELLSAGDILRPLTTATGRRIGPATVDDLAARVHRLRLADDVLAGGDLVVPAFRELRAAIKLYQDSAHSEQVGRTLLTQVGELAQVAGWIASDAGHHDLAERTYQVGVAAAREAGDRLLVGNLAGSLAYQHANIGREREGVEVALAALEEAGSDAPAKVRALFLDRLAWAYAQARQAQLALRALGEAHDALSANGTENGPQWAYWVSQEELEVMDARVFTELRRPLRAVPLLSTVLGRYDPTHVRELALYLSWLAVAYADANEPEAAAVTAARMLGLSTGIASDRAAQRAQYVLRRMASFRDVPEVRAVLAEQLAANTTKA